MKGPTLLEVIRKHSKHIEALERRVAHLEDGTNKRKYEEHYLEFNETIKQFANEREELYNVLQNQTEQVRAIRLTMHRMFQRETELLRAERMGLFAPITFRLELETRCEVYSATFSKFKFVFMELVLKSQLNNKK